MATQEIVINDGGWDELKRITSYDHPIFWWRGEIAITTVILIIPACLMGPVSNKIPEMMRGSV